MFPTLVRVSLSLIALSVLSFGQSPGEIAAAKRLQQSGDFAGAAAAWTTIVETAPENGEAWYMLGYALHAVGRLPEAVHARMQHSPLVLIESTLADRAAHIEREYVHDELAAGTDPAVLCARYVGALDRISKRLGGLRHGAILAPLEAAFAAPYDADAHAVWIAALLSDYYDPMYDYQLDNKRDRIVYRGDAPAVREWLTERYVEVPA